MSSVSSVGGSVDLFSWLQQLNGGGTSASNTPASAVPSASQDGDSAEAAGSTQAAGSHHGHGGHKMMSQLESAITDALNSAKASGATTDPNTIIQNTIQSMLGISPTSPSTASATGTAAGGTTSAQSPDASASQQTAFQQLLQSYGVDASQFQKDFQAALQTSSTNSSSEPDFAKMFQSFPPGTVVNTTA
jgi:hypothetical protein